MILNILYFLITLTSTSAETIVSYKLIYKNFNWHQASRYCKYKGWSLAKVRNEHESELLRKILSRDSRAESERSKIIEAEFLDDLKNDEYPRTDNVYDYEDYVYDHIDSPKFGKVPTAGKMGQYFIDGQAFFQNHTKKFYFTDPQTNKINFSDPINPKLQIWKANEGTLSSNKQPQFCFFSSKFCLRNVASRENCIVVDGGRSSSVSLSHQYGWRDVSCSSRRRFVCEDRVEKFRNGKVVEVCDYLETSSSRDDVSSFRGPPKCQGWFKNGHLKYFTEIKRKYFLFTEVCM